MLPIDKYQIAFNKSKRTSQIKYIVIHDTGNTKPRADDVANYNYFNSGDRQSSADFFIDKDSITQINDYNKNYTWHVGDGKGKYGITNGNSVGIEICINSDGNYDMAVSNTVDLVKLLMVELNIGIDNVVRHYDASRKNCPATMNNGDWAKWYEFKGRLIGDDIVTIEQAKEKLGTIIEPESIQFMEYYKYGDQLIIKIAENLK